MNRSLEDSSIKPKIPIILASGSESRKLMLEEFGLEFDVVISDVDEDDLKEKISKLTIASIFLAFGGIFLMLGGSLTAGQMIGNIAAFIMPISFAVKEPLKH
jgi:hypothetical protein